MSTRSEQPKRIGEAQRVVLGEHIQREFAPVQPKRIGLREAPNARIAIAIRVVEQVRLTIEVSQTFHPDREVERTQPRRVLIRRRVTKWLLLVPCPDELLARVVDSSRRIQMIGVTSAPDAVSPYR